MDPFSAATGIAGLLSVAIQVGMTVGAYVKSVSGASKDAEKLEREIQAFSSVLKQLSDFLGSKDAEDVVFEPTSVLLVATNSCNKELVDLEKKLEKLTKGDKASRILQKLGWPFTEKENRDTVESIHRWTQLYTLSLQTAGCRLLSKVKEDVVESLNLQLEQMQLTGDLYPEVQALRATMSSVHDLVASLPDIQETVQKTYEIVQRLDTNRIDEERMKVLGWLSSIAHHEKHNDTFRRRHENTGMWFLELAEFQDWLKNETQNILWCKGDPGVGKTILASLAIDHIMKTRRDAGVAFFYFDFSAEDDQTPVQILSCLLKQLLLQLADLPAPVRALFDRSVMRGQVPQVSELQELILSIPKEFNTVYLVIDALDECKAGDGRAELLRALQAFQVSMKLLVTSRPHSDDLNESLADVSHVKLRAVESDIRHYVQKKLETRKIQKILGKDTKLKEEIIASIVEGAHGMFLLPTLQIQAILDQTTKSEIRKCLKTLPAKLDDNFSNILKRIEAQPLAERQMAQRVLMWIAHAKRPLKIDELLHGLAVRSGDFDFDEDNLPNEDLVVEYCMGLVQIDPDSSVIRLVHFTLYEYFERRSSSYFPDGHSEIAQSCLTYLCGDAFSHGPCPNDDEYEDRTEAWPLLQYAAQYWGDHARLSIADEYQSLAVKLCSNNQNLGSAIQAMSPGNHLWEGYSQRYPQSYTGLHVATSFGLKAVVEALVDRGANIDAKYDAGETALCMAAMEGDAEVVKLLLERGANVEAEGTVGKRALHHAAWHGHLQVATLLLEKNADIEATDEHEFTPLQMAASYGKLEVLQLLLNNGANREAKNLWTQTSLTRAAVCNHPKAVEILLRSGVDAEAKDKEESTALHMTAAQGLSGVVGVLIDNGANIEAKDIWGLTALHKAASGGHLVTVKILLEKRANIKATSEDGETALHRAALEGHLEVVKLLLARGAEIDATDSNVRTPLYMAASNGHTEVVNFLLSKGAKENREGMALLTAASSGQLELVRKLLDTEEASFTYEYGKLTFLTAASKNNLEVMTLLLEKGVDIEAKDVDGKTALYRAASAGHLAATKLLLDRGANTEVKEKWHAHTALCDAARDGHLAVVKLLLDRGADIEAKESFAGWTVLHWATASDDFDLVKLLLDNGASAETKNGNGGTALDMADWVSHSKIAELFKLRMENASYIGGDGQAEEDKSPREFSRHVFVYVKPADDEPIDEYTRAIAEVDAGSQLPPYTE